MALVPISIKFEPQQREWLQAEACKNHQGRISRLIKALVANKMKRGKKPTVSTT